MIAWAQPDAVVHLAGISDVAGQGLQRAELMTSVNIDATSFLCRALHQQNRPSIFLFISTGLVYQPVDLPNFLGFNENSALGPLNDYGWSKLAAEAITRIYDSGQVTTYVARPFNHTGPGQDLRFVAPSLAKRIIEAEQEAIIPVGNLNAERDFTDVRDIVRAYRLIIERKPKQKTFVLGSGRATPIRDIFKFFVDYSGKNITFERAESLLRIEHSSVFGDPTLALETLGWRPEIPLQKTLKDLYDFIVTGAKL